MTAPNTNASPDLTCEVCSDEPAVGVACIPGMPVSVAYGRRCLDADAHPLWAVVANTAMCGGLDHAADWWKDIIAHTLQHLGVSQDDFDRQVAEAISAEEAAMQAFALLPEADPDAREAP